MCYRFLATNVHFRDFQNTANLFSALTKEFKIRTRMHRKNYNATTKENFVSNANAELIDCAKQLLILVPTGIPLPLT